MAKNISLSTIKTFKNKFLRNNKNTASRNALIKNDLANVALNWENFSQINHNFSNLIKKNYLQQTRWHQVDVGDLQD